MTDRRITFPAPRTPFAEWLRLRFERRFVEGPESAHITVTISIGIALLQDQAPDLDALFAQADRALYEARHRGRNRVHAAADGTTARA